MKRLVNYKARWSSVLLYKEFYGAEQWDSLKLATIIHGSLIWEYMG